MNYDFENNLSALAPTGKSINRDALFFELGKGHKKQYSFASVFLAGAIAASFPWLLLTQGLAPKIAAPSFSGAVSVELIEPVKSEPYSILAYRKVFEATNEIPSFSPVSGGGQVELLSDLQKEFSLYHQ